MSLCVQGMEVAIVSDLIMSGALAHIDNVHVDWPLFTLSDKVAAGCILLTYFIYLQSMYVMSLFTGQIERQWIGGELDV